MLTTPKLCVAALMSVVAATALAPTGAQARHVRTHTCDLNVWWGCTGVNVAQDTAVAPPKLGGVPVLVREPLSVLHGLHRSALQFRDA